MRITLLKHPQQELPAPRHLAGEKTCAACLCPPTPVGANEHKGLRAVYGDTPKRRSGSCCWAAAWSPARAATAKGAWLWSSTTTWWSHRRHPPDVLPLTRRGRGAGGGSAVRFVRSRSRRGSASDPGVGLERHPDWLAALPTLVRELMAPASPSASMPRNRAAASRERRKTIAPTPLRWRGSPLERKEIAARIICPPPVFHRAREPRKWLLNRSRSVTSNSMRCIGWRFRLHPLTAVASLALVMGRLREQGGDVGDGVLYRIAV